MPASAAYRHVAYPDHQGSCGLEGGSAGIHPEPDPDPELHHRQDPLDQSSGPLEGTPHSCSKGQAQSQCQARLPGASAGCLPPLSHNGLGTAEAGEDDDEVRRLSLHPHPHPRPGLQGHAPPTASTQEPLLGGRSSGHESEGVGADVEVGMGMDVEVGMVIDVDELVGMDVDELGPSPELDTSSPTHPYLLPYAPPPLPPTPHTPVPSPPRPLPLPGPRSQPCARPGPHNQPCARNRATGSRSRPMAVPVGRHHSRAWLSSGCSRWQAWGGCWQQWQAAGLATPRAGSGSGSGLGV